MSELLAEEDHLQYFCEDLLEKSNLSSRIFQLTQQKLRQCLFGAKAAMFVVVLSVLDLPLTGTVAITLYVKCFQRCPFNVFCIQLPARRFF